MDRPAASLVVVTHDSSRHLPAFLASVAEQGDGWELIVVDNGSADGSASVVRRLAPAARVVEQENVGFGAGCNTGARLAQAPILVFVNPDTVLRRGFLHAMVAALDRPGTVATGKVLLRDDPGRINTCGNRLHFTGFSTTNGLGSPAQDFPALQEVPGISGAAFAVRSGDWGRLGGFDEDFFLYMEDTELSWRLRRQGFTILLAADAQVEHDYRFGVTAPKLQHLETGRLLLLRKHYRPRHWLAFLPSLLVAEAVAWGWALRLGRAGLAGKARALRRGWRRGIRRSHAPPLRPRAFADRTLPFPAMASSRGLRAAGALANAFFRLNTLGWPRREP